MILLISLATIGAGVLVCCGGIFYVTNHVARSVAEAGRNFAGDIGRAGAEATIRSSSFTRDDKEEMISQIQRVSESFKEGDIGFGDAASLMMELAESPIFAVSTLRKIEVDFLPRSGLSQAEKETAIRILHRAARGVIEESFTRPELDACVDSHLQEWVEEEYEIRTDNREETRTRLEQRYKSPISDEDLNGFLQDVQTLVDDANVPDEPYLADVGGEFTTYVDETLKK